MESRAYKTEVGVASVLSKFYETILCTPVKRIPAMGQTGPDIEINELGLVIDVKSRKTIPSWMFEYKTISVGDFVLIQLDYLHCLQMQNVLFVISDKKVTKEIIGWWNHMDKWTMRKQTNGLTAIVLHKSNSAYHNERSKKANMKYDQSMLMIKKSDLEVLSGRIIDPVRRIRRPHSKQDSLIV